MRINGLTEGRNDGPTGLSSGDPILDQVQVNLSDHGNDVMRFVAAGSEAAQVGANLMSQVIGLMAQSQSQGTHGITNGSQKSSAGPAIAAGVAGLAVGAGVTAAALKGKGQLPKLQPTTSFGPGVHGRDFSSTTFAPGGEEKVSAPKSEQSPKITLGPTVIDVPAETAKPESPAEAVAKDLLSWVKPMESIL